MKRQKTGLSSMRRRHRIYGVWRFARQTQHNGATGHAAQGARSGASMFDDLHRLVGPVLEAPAVQRLSGIAFLGILSPGYAFVHEGMGFASEDGGLRQEAGSDGSRLEHSIGVAHLNVGLARGFGFSIEVQRYAAVWGLLHDLGNWPLSHTAESAFRLLAGMSTRALRRELIAGVGVGARVPKYSMARYLRELGIDLELLLALMAYRLEALPVELATLAGIVQSAMSPDGFEGMWRCGTAVGVRVVAPELLIRALQRDATGTVRLRPGSEAMALEFWRSKAAIYREFFHKPEAIRRESSWAAAVLREFQGLTAEDSLHLSEREVIERVLARGLPDDAPIMRYKPPVDYYVALAPGQTLPRAATMQQLSTVLASRPLVN